MLLARLTYAREVGKGGGWRCCPEGLWCAGCGEGVVVHGGGRLGRERSLQLRARHLCLGLGKGENAQGKVSERVGTVRPSAVESSMPRRQTISQSTQQISIRTGPSIHTITLAKRADRASDSPYLPTYLYTRHLHPKKSQNQDLRTNSRHLPPPPGPAPPPHPHRHRHRHPDR